MAFTTAPVGGGLRGRRFGRYGALSEMNVIPLVDVVLVLLIIFMLTAGAMEFGLDVQVPKVRQSRDTAEELPVVTITRDGEIYLGDKEANINSLREEVRAKFPTARGVYLKADKAVTWEPIAQVISELGLKQDGKPPLEVKVVTQTAETIEKRRR